MNELDRWGYTPDVQKKLKLDSTLAVPSHCVARVLIQFNRFFQVITPNGEWLCEMKGKLKHRAHAAVALPVVGDWVLVEPNSGEKDRGTITTVLPRYSQLVRKDREETLSEQVVAANVDHVMVVESLDHEININRLERFITLVHESGAFPFVVLNKVDQCNHSGEVMEQVQARLNGIPILATSVVSGQGLEALSGWIAPQKTSVLIGPSGVGKSSLLNALLGQHQQHVSEVRGIDKKGRHTTIHRQLFRLANGALLIDTPGVREIQVWGDGNQVETSFPDIVEAATLCKFRDCTHHLEPDCQVRRLVQDGKLEQNRVMNYQKLQSEYGALALNQKQSRRYKLSQEKKRKHFGRA